MKIFLNPNHHAQTQKTFERTTEDENVEIRKTNEIND